METDMLCLIATLDFHFFVLLWEKQLDNPRIICKLKYCAFGIKQKTMFSFHMMNMAKCSKSDFTVILFGGKY